RKSGGPQRRSRGRSGRRTRSVRKPKSQPRNPQRKRPRRRKRRKRRQRKRSAEVKRPASKPRFHSLRSLGTKKSVLMKNRLSSQVSSQSVTRAAHPRPAAQQLLGPRPAPQRRRAPVRARPGARLGPRPAPQQRQ